MMIVFKRLVFFLTLFSVLSCQAADEQITMKNLDQFKASFSERLAVGSSKEMVNAHLKELNLEYSYVESEKKFYAIVRKVGRYRIIYETSLLIRIQLDSNEKVEHIEYELEHTGL
ncbi:hypothetical protein FKG94_07595 [Exilibacterium tricleocarpae]|uniref:DUF3887 domain-containing protein n=1 Tax=Exilibacterium tricleocarpae TaxID=2591008 RepID=A0A545TZF9_9GAMM|nr:hypothetical protein [Exilibacterium tricleocarpae]TQV82587.1 hypothetical protein FKG94_07595 [Exilibacterium tricleocarpae]